MRITAFAKTGLSACLLSAATLALAAEDQAVITFNLPVATHVRQNNPKCNRSLEFSKLLSDRKLYMALIGKGGHSTKQVFASIPAVLAQVQKFGGRTDGLLAQLVGDNLSQCESGCIVLPNGARIKEVFLSDRNGDKGMFDTVGDAWEPSNMALDMGDHGYQDVRFARNNRAVCVTAKNWSLVEPTTQTVRVVFTH